MSISRRTRFKILERDGFRCGYCGATAEEAQLEVDHISPKSRGGLDREENLVAACFDCNRGKRDHQTTVYRSPAAVRYEAAWLVWNENPAGDEFPRTIPRRCAPIDWTIPRAEYPPLNAVEVMEIAECF